MNNREIKTAKDALPYRFVAVKGQSKKIKKVNLNKYDKELYSGKLFCDLHGVNPLILGNEHEVEDINNPKSSTRIKPLIVDGKLVISSYTLKGAISNFLSAYVGDPMTRVEKKGFLFRPNMAFAGNKIDVSAGIVREDEDGDFWVQKIPQPYVFYYDNRNIDLNITHRGSFFNGYPTVINDSRRTRIDNFRNNEFKLFKYNNGLDNHGNFAKAFDERRPKKHNLLGLLSENINDENDFLYIPKAMINNYYKTIDHLISYHIEGHPLNLSSDIKKNLEDLKSDKLKEGDIIFFEYEKNQDEDETQIILTFGKTFYYPWAYSRELTKRWFPKDISYLDDEFIDDEISIIRDMFGYTLGKDDKVLLDKTIIKDMNKNAKSGKIHFNYAVYKGGGVLQENKHLPRPGGPKASSYEFYLQQNGQHPLTTYGDPARKDYDSDVRLSGRKFYMKSSLAGNSFKSNSDDYSIILDKVLIGKPDDTASKFKFTVNFENLTKKQLDLLVGVLNLNENIEGYDNNTLYHQIGYGKNYGMGAVKISVDHGFVIKLYNNILNKENYDKKENSFGDIKLEKLEKNNEFKEILRMYSTEYHYPKLIERGVNPEEATIKWHSKLRTDDLKTRRRR